MSSRASSPSASAYEDFAGEVKRSWRPGWRTVVVPAVDSTNAQARRVLELALFKRAPGATLFVSWTQSAGRGRRGRRWDSSPGGGLYASVLLPVGSTRPLELLPLLVPVALAEALEGSGVEGCGLKWPNDLVLHGRKLGGVLVESVSFGGTPAAAIVGVGINYRAPAGRAAIGLNELLEPAPALGSLARRLLDPLLERLERLDPGQLSELAAAYRSRSVHVPGERLVCRTATETLEGRFAGFDERGFLRLAVGGGERVVGSGELVEG